MIAQSVITRTVQRSPSNRNGRFDVMGDHLTNHPIHMAIFQQVGRLDIVGAERYIQETSLLESRQYIGDMVAVGTDLE